VSAYGALRPEGERYAVRFERLYDAVRLPDELWAALTDPQQLPGRLAHASRFELIPDGDVHLVFEEGDETRGRIVELEPRKRLSFTWRSLGKEAESVVSFEIVPAEHGVKLVLEHTELTPDAVPGYAARGHAHLDVLAGSVPGGRRAMLDRYQELRPEYEERMASL
jgi:uncharacterized protein YndB with AHSA1/START domain